MSDIVSPVSTDSELEHFGVKGMRWGVRRDRRGRVKARHVVNKARLNRYELADQRTPQGYGTLFGIKRNKAIDDTMTKASPKIRRAVRRINRDPRFLREDLRRQSDLQKQYHEEISKAITDQLNAASEFKGYTTDRQYKLRFNYDVEKSLYPEITIVDGGTRAGRREAKREARRIRRFRHSDAESIEIEFKARPILDDLGHILDIEIIHNPDETIEHHGVPGMKWGVRKDRASRVSSGRSIPKKAAATPSKPKTKPQMTDAELRARIERLQLEKRYSELTAETKTKSVGRQIVEKILQDSVQDAGKTLLKDVLVTQGRKALSGVLDGKK